MSIRTTCEACGFVFQVKDEFAGVKAKCSSCGAVVQVPVATPDATAPAKSSKPAPQVTKAKPKITAKPPQAAKSAARPAGDSAPVIDVAAAAPPKKAASAKQAAAAPPKAAAPASDKSDTAAAAGSAFALNIDTGDDENPAASRTTARPGGGRRKAANNNTPLLIIIAVLAVALVGATAVGALFITGVLGGGDEVANSDGENWETKTPGEQTNNPTDNNKPGPNDDPEDDVDKGPIEYANGFSLEDSLYVRELKDVSRAVVKFEIPNKDGTGGKTGTGFFIDKRGWVATNFHVIDGMTTDARVKMENGDKLEIAGVIAQVKERDLAIVKLAEKPLQVVLLDIDSFMKEPEYGDEIYSFGHPLSNEFALTRGIVSRVMTTGDMSRNHPGHLLTTINAPASQVWIQHDSKINPGNSGGPIFNKECQVIGVNSFQDKAAGFGFASHIRHLRDIVATATDSVTPLPEGRGGGTLTVTEVPNLSGAEMEKVFDECKAFSWTPTNAEQYAKMAKLAGALATASGEDNQVAITLFGDLRGATWTDEQVNAINKFAAGQIDKINRGIMLVGSIKQARQSEFGSLLVMEVSGCEKLVVVENAPDVSAQENDRVLVLGLVLPHEPRGVARAGNKMIYGRWVNSRHVLKL